MLLLNGRGKAPDSISGLRTKNGSISQSIERPVSWLYRYVLYACGTV